MSGKGKGKEAPPMPPRGTACPPPPGDGTRLRASVDFSSVKLRPTETHIRLRDGTILHETRGSDGYTAVTVGKDNSKPQYVLDQEAGFSSLQPKVFDSSSQRWVTRPERDPYEISQVGERLRLVTYNVWFSSHMQHLRAKALLEILDGESADIVCLQEVTPQFLSCLRECPWARERYLLSDSVGTTLRGSELVYGVIMMFNIHLCVRSLSLHVLPTQMNRAVLVASVAHGGRDLRVATAHLESLRNEDVRASQLEVICAALGASSDVPVSIIAGDMNFDDGSAQEEAVVAKNEFTDVWRELGSEGTGGITMCEDDVSGAGTRIDRIFFRSGRASFIPSSLRLLGTEPIESGEGTRPSDHFGLCCDFSWDRSA